MFTAVLLITISVLLILFGIFGKRFVTGLAARGRLPVLSGRSWLVVVGIFLFVAGLIQIAPRLGAKESTISGLHRLSEYSNVLFNGLMGLGALVGVVVACLTIASEVNKKAAARRRVVGIAIAILIGSLLFVWSSIASIFMR